MSAELSRTSEIKNDDETGSMVQHFDFCQKSYFALGLSLVRFVPAGTGDRVDGFGRLSPFWAMDRAPARISSSFRRRIGRSVLLKRKSTREIRSKLLVRAKY